jgi:hypothetical protein
VSCTLKICKRTTVTLPGIGRPKKELKGAGGTGPKPASSAEHPMAAGPFLRWPPNLMVTSSATTPPLTKMPSARSTFLSADFNGLHAAHTRCGSVLLHWTRKLERYPHPCGHLLGDRRRVFCQRFKVSPPPKEEVRILGRVTLSAEDLSPPPVKTAAPKPSHWLQCNFDEALFREPTFKEQVMEWVVQVRGY